eukprot:TRINITY_DN39492_c0_g1_i1.p1 TRINITY_DN39492_c0_g1~~TRINITY_DN39492_c0_g1_i1.p1  ORF type:complete len:281 (+),score=35.65 TRINITY_DN39492_c0_g1_i1:80-844(+)
MVRASRPNSSRPRAPKRDRRAPKTAPRLAEDALEAKGKGEVDLVTKAEEQTTDAGSSAVSDAESMCSSMSSASQRGRGGPRPLGRSNKRWAPAALSGHVLLGTQLEPIPGTPSAAGADNFGLDEPCSPKNPAKSRSVSCKLSTKLDAEVPDARAALSTDVHAGVLAAQPLIPTEWNQLPLKVRLPAYAPAMSCARLDPLLPAKKRPAFPELVSISSAATRKLDPNEPIKKRLTGFLLAEPLQVLSAPGLPARPR